MPAQIYGAALFLPPGSYNPCQKDDDVVDIFDEVDEDVRRERMHQAAKKYGPIVGLVVALVIVGVGGSTLWREYQVRKADASGEAYLAAGVLLNEDKASEAAIAFAAIPAESGDGYAALARMREAEAHEKAGDRQAALSALHAIDSLEAPDRYKELARLLALGLRSYDEDAATLLPLVEPMAAAGRPWRALANEYAAMLEWKLGKLDAAKTRLEAISADATAPTGVRTRADAALTAFPKG